MPLSLRIGIIALMILAALTLGTIGIQILQPAHVAVAPQAPAPEMVNYLVAATPLPAGTLARDEDFSNKAVPVAQLPPGAIEDTPVARADLRGALIRAYLDAGQVVTQEAVLRPRDRGFIASVLKPGMRAASVGVDPVTGVSGLIWPGDHVDVILTQNFDDLPPSRRVLSETVLQDVRVIGIDQAIVQGAPSGAQEAGKLARTVTLEVTPDEAERITVAERLGRITLTIRSAKDEAAPDAGALSATFGSDVSPALARPDKPVGVTVQVIEGKDRKEVVFR